MKKLFATVGILLISIFCIAPAMVSAVDVLGPGCQGKASASPVCKENQSSSGTNPLFGPSGVLTVIMKWLARIVGIAAVLVMAIAGLTLAISGGEASEAATARRSLLYAAIGLVIALFAQILVSFVLSKLKA